MCIDKFYPFCITLNLKAISANTYFGIDIPVQTGGSILETVKTNNVGGRLK